MGKLIAFAAGVMSMIMWQSYAQTPLVREVISAQREGRLINNEIMNLFNPHTFHSGIPQYLERDFEAGADFICDSILYKYGEDLCINDGIGWR